jgi:hypothetical protein
MKLRKADIDVSRVFLAFMAFSGDVSRTAVAVDLDPATVEALAVEEKWHEKMDQYSALRAEDCNLQVQMNRALNYVQAHQLRLIVDSVISELAQSKERLMESLTIVTKAGVSFSAKPLTDLVKAAEAVQLMTARALGDQGGRVGDSESGGGSIGLSVARALNAVATNQGVDSVALVKKQFSPE